MCYLSVWCVLSGGQARGRDAGDAGAGRVQHRGVAGGLDAGVRRPVARRRQPRVRRRHHRRGALHRRARAALSSGKCFADVYPPYH